LLVRGIIELSWLGALESVLGTSHALARSPKNVFLSENKSNSIVPDSIRVMSSKDTLLLISSNIDQKTITAFIIKVASQAHFFCLCKEEDVSNPKAPRSAAINAK